MSRELPNGLTRFAMYLWGLRWALAGLRECAGSTGPPLRLQLCVNIHAIGPSLSGFMSIFKFYSFDMYPANLIGTGPGGTALLSRLGWVSANLWRLRIICVCIGVSIWWTRCTISSVSPAFFVLQEIGGGSSGTVRMHRLDRASAALLHEYLCNGNTFILFVTLLNYFIYLFTSGLPYTV